jgi:type VI secretion system protein ImpL
VKSLRQDAATLPPAVGGLVARIADRAAGVAIADVRGELETRYRQDVVRPCQEVVNDRYPFLATSATEVPPADFGRIFGYGGVFDTFFKERLEQLVITSRQSWTWRTDASGASVGGSGAMLRQFEAAQRIRDMFFRPGSQTPELQFTVTPVELDVGTMRFLLEIDGQSFEYRHGPERSFRAKWPGQNPGTAAVTFEERSGARSNVVKQGPWAWLRLIDEAQIQRETDVRYLLTFDKGGHQARVRVEPETIRNPYGKRDLQQFRCAS